MAHHPETPVWRVSLVADTAAMGEAAAAAVSEVTEVVSIYDEDKPRVRVEGFTDEKPDRGMLSALLALVLAPFGTSPVFEIEKLPSRDWVSENQASFPPLRVGRYFVHGSHHQEAPPAGTIPLLIDAATAFGTGEHATTKGCLTAMGRLRRRFRPARILDMGTGTGILAIAAAKSWAVPVVACDIDGESVRVAAENARVNQVAAFVHTERSVGYRSRLLRNHRPFDLVFANILAKPLVLMATDLAQALAPDGKVVLSGLLSWQEPYVLAAHRQVGMRFFGRIAIDGWHTLLLSR